MLGSFIIFLIILETVTNTISTTVDTSKNVAAAAVDKGTTLIGTAKGSFILLFLITQFINLKCQLNS